MAEFSVVDRGAWASQAGASSPLSVSYPASAADGTASAEDMLYLFVHSKPDTGSVGTPTDWTLVDSATGGGGAVGASTGPTRLDVYRRTVPGGGLSGSLSVTISSANVAQGKIIQCRPDAAGSPTWSEELASFSRTTTTSSLAFTSTDSISVQDDDHVIVGILSPDDGAGTDESLTAVTQSGTTFGTPVELDAKANTTLANDLGSDIWDVEATAGSGTGTISNTGTSAANETRLFTWLRIRLAQSSSANGDATSTITAATSAVGTAVSFGSATSAITADASVSGTALSFGATTSEVTAGASVSGTALSFGAVSSSVTAGVSAAGEAAGLGSATSTVTAGASVGGTAVSFGAVSSAISALVTAVGTAVSFGSATSTVTAGVSASGVDAGAQVTGPLLAGVPSLVEGPGVGAVSLVSGLRPGSASAVRSMHGGEPV